MYELAAEFGCHRTTVAERLKKAGISMRGQSPTPEVIDSMVRFYASGLSLVEVGEQTRVLRKHSEELLGCSTSRARDTISPIVKRSPFIQSISRTSFPRTRPASP